MEGYWRVHPGPRAPREHDPWVRALLATDEAVALGHRLGMLHVVRTRDEHTLIGHLGPDVLDEDFPTVGLEQVSEVLDQLKAGTIVGRRVARID